MPENTLQEAPTEAIRPSVSSTAAFALWLAFLCVLNLAAPIYLFPRLAVIFSQLGGELPWITQQQINLSDFLLHDGIISYPLLAFVYSGAVAVFYLIPNPRARTVYAWSISLIAALALIGVGLSYYAAIQQIPQQIR